MTKIGFADEKKHSITSPNKCMINDCDQINDCDLHYKNANERDYAIKLRIRACCNKYVASGALFGSD